MVAMVALLFTVICPLMEHLINQSEGARILLQMIPAKVRHEVPAINEFFQTGNVNRDVDIINYACKQTHATSLLVISRNDVILKATP